MNYSDMLLTRGWPVAASETARVHYSRTVAPTSEALTVDEAVRHLQLAAGDDTGYVSSLISVARDVAENATGRALMTSTWLGVTGCWPACGMLPLSVGPITAISSVKYYAEGETSLTTVDAADYVVSTATTPAVIVFGEDFDAPTLADRPDAVQVTFVAGAANPTQVPPALKHALRILIRHYYDHPDAVDNASFNELPFGLRHLLESNRIAGWVG